MGLLLSFLISNSLYFTQILIPNGLIILWVDLVSCLSPPTSLTGRRELASLYLFVAKKCTSSRCYPITPPPGPSSSRPDVISSDSDSGNEKDRVSMLDVAFFGRIRRVAGGVVQRADFEELSRYKL